MRNLFRLARLAAWLAVLCLVIGQKSGWTQPSDRQQPTLTVEELRSRLRKTVNLSFQNTPLKECVAQVCAVHQIPYHWNDAALEEEGIILKELDPVTDEFRRMTVKAALDRLFNEWQLGYCCTDSGLECTAKASTGLHVLRVYDVTPLLHKPTASGYQLPALREDRLANTYTLMLNIMQSVKEHNGIHWMEDIDGEAYKIYFVDSRHACLMIVKQPEEVHFRLEDYLNELLRQDQVRRPRSEPNRVGSGKQAHINPPRIRVVSGGTR